MEPIVKPETWYRIYWTLMGLGFMVVNFFVMREAVAAAIVQAARVLGWTKD